jgi:hypothetical protein
MEPRISSLQMVAMILLLYPQERALKLAILNSCNS